LTPQKRGQWIQLARDVSFKFESAGHIIGASSIQFSLTHPNGSRILAFSGDLGHFRSLTMRPPETIAECDALVIESTYGDRTHKRNDVVKEFAAIAKRTFDRRGVLVIPAFAVGRAQEILYIIRLAENLGLIPSVPVLLDSPMSKVATKVFFDHPEDHKEGSPFSKEQGRDCYLPSQFTTTTTSDDSMLACMKEGPMVVISAAGMLNGGRILHHLKARLPKEENTVLFCGYQAEGTKGRTLQDRPNGLDKLRIHHLEVPIEAEIATMESLSAHGDWQDLSDWVKRMTKPPSHVIINHGNPDAMNSFALKLKELLPRAKITPMLSPGAIQLF
jgi:metallo-beta-lactamase family protein